MYGCPGGPTVENQRGPLMSTRDRVFKEKIRQVQKSLSRKMVRSTNMGRLFLDLQFWYQRDITYAETLVAEAERELARLAYASSTK